MPYKVCILTGSRAEYGLLEPLITKCKDHFDVQLVATGSHLSHEFGYTVKDINHDITERVEIVLSSNTAVGISKSMGLAMISFGEVFDRLKPDLLIVLGDRHEIFSAVSAAYVATVPICHIHGGEITEGSYDDGFRHAITKMSSLHFPCAPEYAARIVQLGESPDVVFSVGALGCEGLMKRRNHKSTRRFIYCCYPETAADIRNTEIYAPMKAARPEDSEIMLIGGSADTGALCAVASGENATRYDSMPRDDFISELVRCDAIVGNSSCGIIEAPALGVPTINVGSRQKGRLMAGSIIQAEPTKESISAAFDKLYSDGFQTLMATGYHQPYKGGAVAQNIVNIIKDRMPISVKEGFYDMA